VAAGLLFLAAGLAKQIGWPLGLLCALAYTSQRKPGIPELWGTLVFGTVALFLLLPSLFGEWAYFYIFEVLAGHATEWSFASFGAVAVKVGRGWLLAAWALIRFQRGADPGRGQVPMIVALLLGWSVVFVMGAVHAGAYDNVFLPALLLSAFGVMIAGGVVDGLPESTWTRAVLGFCIVQMAVLVYDPRTWVPSDSYRAECEALEVVIAESDGPWLSLAASRPGFRGSLDGSV